MEKGGCNYTPIVGAGALKRGRITPAVAVVVGAQAVVSIEEVTVIGARLNGVLRTGDIRTRSYN